MIDFSAVKKFIYFPHKAERRKEPYLIQEFEFFHMERCQPYSDELWEKCVAWISKRDLLEAEYLKLMNGE